MQNFTTLSRVEKLCEIFIKSFT